MSAAVEDQIVEEMTPEAETPAPPPPDEPDEPDTDEPDDDDEPEDVAAVEEAEQPLSEKDIEKLNQRLEAERDRHTKRISEIMGDDAVALVRCEACDDKIPGWHWPAEIFSEGSPERTLYELLAGGTDAQMTHPDRFRVCEYCNGFGQVLTGARNDIHRTLICPECRGDGYRDREAQTTPVVQLAAPPANAEPFEPGTPPSPEKDFLGRPVGHVNYGKMSTYLTPAEQAIDTRDGFGV